MKRFVSLLAAAVITLASAAALAHPGHEKKADGKDTCPHAAAKAEGKTCPHAEAKAAAAAPDTTKTDGFVCAMGPECSGIQPKGGECPKCGMKLIPMSEYLKKK